MVVTDWLPYTLYTLAVLDRLRLWLNVHFISHFDHFIAIPCHSELFFQYLLILIVVMELFLSMFETPYLRNELFKVSATCF